MTLAGINKKLLTIISNDEKEGNREFLQLTDTIDEFCTDRTKIFSRFDLPGDERSRDKDLAEGILLSTLFSDTTRVYSNSRVGNFKRTDDYIPDELHRLLLHCPPGGERKNIQIVTAGTYLFTAAEAAYLNNNFLPLFESGQLTLSPNHHLLISATKPDKAKFYTLPAEKTSNSKLWRAPLTGDYQQSIPIVFTVTRKKQSALSKTVRFSFLSGLNSTDFARILQDEKDLLLSFRSTLKLLTELKPEEEKYRGKICRDIVQPVADRVTERFMAMADSPLMKNREAVVASATLSLIKPPLGDYLAAASTLLSKGAWPKKVGKTSTAAGIIHTGNEPCYMLWKLSIEKS